MSVILVDTKYYGHHLMSVRKQLRIKRDECARLLGVSCRDMKNMERGQSIISEKVLHKIMSNGLLTILCKRRK